MSIPSDTELTMREERWMPCSELLTTEPPVVTAFRTLHGRNWEVFRQDLTEGALHFFNPERPEFSHALTWEELADEYGVRPCGRMWRIPEQLSPAAHQTCRQIRQNMRHVVVETEPKMPVFWAPDDSGWKPPVALVVCYTEWPYLATYFQPELGHPERCVRMLAMLESRGLAPSGAGSNSCTIIRKVP